MGEMKTMHTRQLVVTITPALFILATMVFVHVHSHVPFVKMTRDIASQAHISPLSGVLSNLGIILWCVSASVCFFAATLLRQKQPRECFWFMLSAAFLTTYLLFDDLFMFHEALAGWYLGLDQKFIYVAIGIAATVYLLRFRRIILRTRFDLLVLAFGFLAASVVIDVIRGVLALDLGGWEHLFEDGTKWLGIAFWCSYHVITAYRLLTHGVEGRDLVGTSLSDSVPLPDPVSVPLSIPAMVSEAKVRSAR